MEVSSRIDGDEMDEGVALLVTISSYSDSIALHSGTQAS